MAKTKHHTTKLWIYSITLWISSILAKGNNCLRGSCRSDCGGYSISSSFSAALHTLLQDYDNALRPTHHQGKTTDVICDVYINSFDSISVDTMDFSVNIYMRETWKDSRLAYQHLFPNLTRITLDHRVFDRIWVPDLFFPNEKAASTHCVTVPNAMIRIQPNGSIMYSSRYTLTLSCHMRLRRYPFDKQECFMRIESSSRGGFFVPNKTLLQSMRYSLRLACHMNLRRFPLDKQICHMRIESYSYTLEEMKLRWSNDSDPVQTNEDLTLPQFELLDVKTHHCHKSYITDSYTVDEMLLRWKRFIPVQINDELELPQFILVAIATTQCSQSYVTGDFACLEIRFTLQRQYGYFMIQTYVPSILIVTLSWVAFWINIDAVPARISLGVLTVLTLTTQCVGVWMSLPRVSYVKAIDVWMSFCIIAVFAAMLEFALVNTLARKEIRRLSMRVRKTEKIENNSDLPSDMIKRMMDEYTYGVPQKYDPNSRMLARKVDKVSRWLFPFVFIVFNVAYWCIYLIE